MGHTEETPRHLELMTTVLDANGKEKVDRQDVIACEKLRYWVKRVALPHLPVGEYVAELAVGTKTGGIATQQKFRVR